MTPKHLFIFLVLIICSVSFAQEKLNIAVVDLDPQGVADSEAKIISGRLRSDLFNTNKFDILEREKMEQVLQEQGFQLTGCTSDECAVEIGKVIGVSRIVAGSIGKLGSIYTLNIRMINVETGRVENIAIEDCECPIETVLTQAINRVARKLAGEDVAPLPAQKPDVKPVAQPQQQPVNTKPTPTRQTTTISRPAKKNSNASAFFGFSAGTAEYDIGSDIFSSTIYPYEFNPALSNNFDISMGGKFPMNIRLSGFLKISQFDEAVGNTTYSGTLFIVGPKLQYNWSWFYLGYSYGFVKLRFDENSEDLIFGTDEEDYDKTVNMYSFGLDVPLTKNFHLNAEMSVFEHYKTITYGVLLFFN